MPRRLIYEFNTTSDAHSAYTRESSNRKIIVPILHVDKSRNSFKYRCAVLWNTLPHDIREAENIDEFAGIGNIISTKKRLKCHTYSVFNAHILIWWRHKALCTYPLRFLNAPVFPSGSMQHSGEFTKEWWTSLTNRRLCFYIFFKILVCFICHWYDILTTFCFQVSCHFFYPWQATHGGTSSLNISTTRDVRINQYFV